jgi:predicted transcriptional regulator of viral defense system
MFYMLYCYCYGNIDVFRDVEFTVDSRSLSKTEAKIILSMEAERIDLVSLDEVQVRAGVSPGFARKLAHDLVRKGWLQRARRGQYLLNPSSHGPDALRDTDPFRVGSHLVAPYYFGYASAAELEGLLPQASSVYFLVTTARWVPGEVAAHRFRVVHVSPSRFFGVRSLVRRGVSLFVSDLERTVLDCLNRPELAGGMAGASHIFAVAKPRLNWSRLSAYLDRFGSESLRRRARFLSEILRPSVQPPAGWIRRSLPGAREPYVPLGAPKTYGRSGPRDARWRIVRNVSDAELYAEGKIR